MMNGVNQWEPATETSPKNRVETPIYESPNVSEMKNPISSINQIFEEYNPRDRQTNIICTIDHGTNGSIERLGKMIDAGMNVAKINFDSNSV